MTNSANVRPVAPTFLRLDGRIGWRDSGKSSDIFYDAAAGGLRLGDENATAILPTEPGGSFGGLTRPTSLAVGADNRLFLADPNHNRILTYTTHEQDFVPLWEADDEATAPDPYALNGPRGVAVSRDGDLVVADTGNGRIIIYTWPGLVARHIIKLGEGRPWDIAVDSDGRIHVADPAAGRVHRFDRLWLRDEGYLGGADTLQMPQHLALDSEDRLLVLDMGTRMIVELDEAGNPLPDLNPPLFERTLPPALYLDGNGLWLPQDSHPNCPALELPGLTVTRSGRLAGFGLPLLARPAGVNYPRNGRYLSEALDSKIFDCAWHRLVLDVDLPENTSLLIRTYTAPADPGIERIENLPNGRWSTPLTIKSGDIPEILVQSKPGRFLWLSIEVRSNGDDTPLIGAATLFAPRQSSLDFLPPVFREDAVSADFLGRFLSYFDTVFQEVETLIEQFTGYLDPMGVPAGDFLTWLGGWFDLEFLAEWSEDVRREFIARAIELYKQRGTLTGLQEIIRLHTGTAAPYPVIVEHFRLRDYEERFEPAAISSELSLAGFPLQPDPNDAAHHFTLVLPEQAIGDDKELDTLNRLTSVQKPAHTKHEIRIVKAGLTVGCQSTIGVDTLIGRPPTGPLGEMLLTAGAKLMPEEPVRQRIGYSRLTFS